MQKNKNLLTFEQLSKTAQEKVCQDYINGWLVTHPEEKDEVDLNWAKDMCLSDDRTLYSEDGSVLEQ